MTRIVPFVIAGAVTVAVATFVGVPYWLAVPLGYAAMLAAAGVADHYLNRIHQVLAAMPPGQHVYATDLGKQVYGKWPSGRIYVHLAKLEQAGLVHSGWDELEPGREHRRRWYERVAR